MLLPPALPPWPQDQGRGAQKGRKTVPCLFKRVSVSSQTLTLPHGHRSRWGGLGWAVCNGNKGPFLPGSWC